MRSAITGIDVVAEGINARLIACIVLARDLNLNMSQLLIAFRINDIRMNNRRILVQVFNVFTYAAFKEEGDVSLIFFFLTKIRKTEADTLVQKSQLTQTVTQRHIVINRRFGEDFRISLELYR